MGLGPDLAMLVGPGSEGLGWPWYGLTLTAGLQGWRNDFGGGGRGFSGVKVTPSKNGQVTGFGRLFFEKGQIQQNRNVF